MVNHCANPKCAKPLHYLREGRIFVFEATASGLDSGAKKAHSLEHYWLCGDCSQTLFLEKTMTGIRLEPKGRVGRSVGRSREAIAS
jgi:hypothetical protein